MGGFLGCFLCCLGPGPETQQKRCRKHTKNVRKAVQQRFWAGSNTLHKSLKTYSKRSENRTPNVQKTVHKTVPNKPETNVPGKRKENALKEKHPLEPP